MPSGGIGGVATPSGGTSGVGVGGGSANAAGVGGGAAPTYAPTFTAIFSEIFPKYSCNLGACHAATSMKVTADPASTYMNIINTTASGADQPGLPACGSTGKKLVVPNNTNDSLLLLKVKPSPPCGARMRLTGPYLDDREIDQITQWIQMGAPNN
jgi:hypothetical protein